MKNKFLICEMYESGFIDPEEADDMIIGGLDDFYEVYHSTLTRMISEKVHEFDLTRVIPKITTIFNPRPLKLYRDMISGKHDLLIEITHEKASLYVKFKYTSDAILFKMAYT